MYCLTFLSLSLSLSTDDEGGRSQKTFCFVKQVLDSNGLRLRLLPLLLHRLLLGYLHKFEQRQELRSQNIPTLSSSYHFRFEGRCGEPVPSKLIRRTVVHHIFNGTSPFTNLHPPHLHLPLLLQKRVGGWSSNCSVFENLIRRVKPRTIIEIGTFLGASAIHMAQLTKGLGLRTQILRVDDFGGWPGYSNKFRDIDNVIGDWMMLQQFMQNVNYMNLTHRIMPLPFSSTSALSKLCEIGVLGDLIEVDAGHDFHSTWNHINFAYKILRPGGVIFGHDYDGSGVRRAVHLFTKAKGLKVQSDGQHWVIESA